MLSGGGNGQALEYVPVLVECTSFFDGTSCPDFVRVVVVVVVVGLSTFGEGVWSWCNCRVSPEATSWVKVEVSAGRYSSTVLVHTTFALGSCSTVVYHSTGLMPYGGGLSTIPPSRTS